MPGTFTNRDPANIQSGASLLDLLMPKEDQDFEFDPPRAGVAATTLVQDVTVVTRNGTDFDTTSVAIVNPSEYEGRHDDREDAQRGPW